MEIKEIIEKGIKGGWNKSLLFYSSCEDSDKITFISKNNEFFTCISIKDIVLDPKFWKAVGKTIGAKYEYTDNMHHMVSALIHGNSIEDFIKSL